MSDMLYALSVNPDQPSWEDFAACRGMTIDPDHDYFFEGYEQDEETARNIDKMCLGCPVIGPCDKMSVTGKMEGVWGGAYRTPTGKIDFLRNKHKTDEDWKLLEERLGRRIQRPSTQKK